MIINKLDLLLEEFFRKGIEKFKFNKEIKNIEIINREEIDEKGRTIQVKYLEFLLYNTYLNEKDVDLIDIELMYTVNKEIINIEGWLYPSDGKVFREFALIGTIKEVTSKIEEFINSGYDIYPEVAKLYTIESLWKQEE